MAFFQDHLQDVQIKYRGFHPSPHTKAFIESLIQEVHDEAPYGATIRATFAKGVDGLNANVRIFSSAGFFFAAARDGHLKNISHKILEQLRRRFAKRQSKRTQHTSLRRDFNLQPAQPEPVQGEGVA